MVLTEEERKERNKLKKQKYRQSEKGQQTEKEYYQKNKQKIAEREKEYRDKNKDKIKETKKLYRQTPNGIKIKTISCWRTRGVIGDLDELYDKYINTDKCEICEKVFTDTYDRCLDHDHETGEFRYILCNACNSYDSWINKIKD